MTKRLATNVQGNFYVTTDCINCDQCRQIAPEIFTEVGDFSSVFRQPKNREEEDRAFYALLSCPTGAIGSENVEHLQAATKDFPLPVTQNIYYCGYTSRQSWGASSYLIVHPDGNWLVDSPRWSPQLVAKIEQMGGLKWIFLTHRDDVADAAKYAERFGAERIIHEKEIMSQPDAEHQIKGVESVEWAADFRIIPQPGHTAGHMVLLYQQRYLFSGDHLAWSKETQELTAHPDVCWYSWDEQKKSMKYLVDQSFEWILPGHGQRVQLPYEQMRKAMIELVKRMHATS